MLVMISVFLLLIHFASAITVDSFILKNANNMERDTVANTVVLQGDVQIIYQQQYISADEAVIHLKTQTVEALGNVIYTTPEIYAEADKMFFNYDNNTGIIYNGYVQSGQVSFEGELIYKIGDKEFEASDANYSSCISCPPAWMFSGSEIKATFGGYARIKNTVLRIVNIPIFWFPYIIVPIKNERQTGVLAPSHEISKQGGNAFAIPFYWAINDSSDMTFTLKNYELRGLKTLLEYRYVLSPSSRGIMNYAYIKDEVFPESARHPSPIDKRSRWFFTYKHTYELPSYFEHRADINLASDLQYPYDYLNEFDFYREPSIPNRVSLSRYHPDYHISMDTFHHTNLLKTDPLADNEEAVHMMPHIRWSLKNRKFGKSNLFYKMDLDYTNYARSTYSFDDEDNDFVFDSGTENVRSGQRLITRPEVFVPLQIGNRFDVLASMAYQNHYYKFPDTALGDTGALYADSEESPSQEFLQTRISFRTLFSKVFSNGSMRHKSLPYLTYTKLPHVKRNDHPFWQDKINEIENEPYNTDKSIGDDDILQFDFRDRLVQTDYFEYGINNIFTKKTGTDLSANYNDILVWRIFQRYDFKEAEKDDARAEPFSNITNEIQYRYGRWGFNSIADYYPYQNRTNSNSTISFYPKSNNYISLGYNQAFEINRGERYVSSRSENQDILLGMAYSFGSFNIAGNFEYSAVTYDFEDYRYGIQYMPPGDCWFLSISQVVNSQDIVTKINFEFLFDGKRKDRFRADSIF